ncbi:hypothetical protein C0J52_02288 [Blattella germanica]|nr:hypothetical protein C0J52_02288 [Blattella germanica]
MLNSFFDAMRHVIIVGVVGLRFLDRYEKVHYLGEDVDRGSDDDEESRHRRWSARALHSVPLVYNHHQHNVAGKSLFVVNTKKKQPQPMMPMDQYGPGAQLAAAPAPGMPCPAPPAKGPGLLSVDLWARKRTPAAHKLTRISADHLHVNAAKEGCPKSKQLLCKNVDSFLSFGIPNASVARTAINSPHVSLHLRVGGSMSYSGASAAEDKNTQSSTCLCRNALRSYNGLSSDLYKPSDYDRLALSLMSPLPNEQDFAINVCTLLSNEGKHTLKLDKYPRLIDFLLAHAGIFNHSSTRELFEEVYGDIRRHSLKHFWLDALTDADVGELVDESLFPTKKPKVKEVICESAGKAGASGAKDESVATNASKCSDKVAGKSAGDGEVVEKMEVDGPKAEDAPKAEETESPPKNEDATKEGMVDSATSMEVDMDVFVDECATETAEPKGEQFVEGEDGLLCEVVEKSKTEAGAKEKIPLDIDHSDFELFCLGRSFGTQDYIGQRVLQVATILRNLSFGEENVTMLARNVPFLRFLLLCAGSRWNCLHQLGLDMLGNIASEMLLEDPVGDRLAASLLSTVTRGLHSQDRLIVLSCLEVLNKLSQKDENEEIMLRCLDQRVYDQVCTFLTLHDIMLLIYTLECLYSLSSLGERACNCIVRVHGAIDTLVSLITVEAQSYGPKACILMRVVETVSGTQAGTTATTTTTTTTSAMATGTANASPAPVVSTPVRTPVITPSRQTTPQSKCRVQSQGLCCPEMVLANKDFLKAMVIDVAGMVIGAPQPAVATPVTLTMSQTPQQYQQQQHAHQQAAQENEQFALAWLRATYEPATGCRIEQGELYKQYLTACAKIGRRGVIAPLHFPRCVRSVFGGTVGPNPQKQAVIVGTAGTEQHVSNLMFYEGIKVRTNPFSLPATTAAVIQQAPLLPSPQTAQQSPVQNVSVQVQPRKALNVVTKTVAPPPPTTSPAPVPEPAGDGSLPLASTPASPILKAQLSAPPKPRETPKGDAKSQVLAHPHLTQALLGSGGGTPSPAAGGKASATASNKEAVGGPPTSLIKSLLATKVNAAGSECMMAQPAATSMMPAACSTTTTTTTASTSTKQPPPTPQVTQRQQQQRLLQQQLQTQIKDSTSPPPPLSPSNSKTVISTKGKPAASTTAVKSPDARQRTSRINGARTPLQQAPPLQAQTQAISQAQTQTPTQIEQAKEVGSEMAPTTSTTATVITSTSQCSAGTSVITPTRVIAENHISSPALGIGGGNLALRGRREPPQPPPPPLAPLNNSRLPPRLDVEDSDSTGNNSLASSSRDCSGTGAGNISSTDDGENSLTSFEGLLLNGIPHSLDIDAASNDSSSKDSARSATKPVGTKSLMLADLLEKKVDKKEPPILNGVLGKELRIGEKGLELVENHLEKVLKESSVSKPSDGKEPCSDGAVKTAGEKSGAAFKTVGIGTTDEPLLSNSAEQAKFGVVTQQTQTVKRPASDNPGNEDGVTEAKRPHLSSESAVNGTTSSPEPPTAVEENNPAPPRSPEDKSPASNASGDNSEVVNASPSAANLYAALAASALEDEPDLELPPPPPTQVLVQSASGLRQAVFLGQGVESAAQQQLIVTAAPRQIIVSQGQLAPQGQVLITAGGQITLQQGPNAATATIKTPSGHQAVPVLVQTGGSAAQRTQISAVAQGTQLGQVVLTQSSSGQFILSQAPTQGQVQLVQAGSGQAGQYIMSAGGSSGQAHYVVAQPQTALVQGQTQTVLVAQTPQQQGTGSKTIIILQPQTSPAATHHQKVVVTPQGQPVVVTQVPRPLLQSPAISNPPPALVPTSGAPPTSTQPVKHTTAITAVATNSASRGMQPSLVASAGSSTSLPTSQSQQRSITPTNSSSSTMAPISPSAITAKPQMVQPTPRPSLSPTPNAAIASPRATPVQMAKQMRTMPTTRPSPIGSPVSDAGADKSGALRNPKIPSQPTTPQTRPQATGSITDSIFLCEWRGCMRSFKSANEVYMHACEAHCPFGSEEIQCLWERCDAMKRKRFSLMTHLYDRHCNADVLRMMAVRRRQLSQSGRSEIPPPQPPPPHPGYAPNAAFHAIKRHALEFVNPKEMMRPAKPGPPVTIPARTGPSPPEQDDNEGPVTKSIRLTSSLILRNLVIYSTNGRRFLRSYEPHLASVALSNVESSRTIAQVLYDMNQQTSER